MADQKENQDTEQEQSVGPYIKEKIRKKRFNPLRIFVQIVAGLFLAVLFGAVASVAFVTVLPWARQIDKPEESTPSSMVELPTYSQGTSQTETSEEAAETEQQTTLDENELAFNDVQKQWIRNLISTMLENRRTDISDIRDSDNELNKLYERVSRSIATVNGYRDSKKAELIWTASGLVFYENRDANELLILTSAKNVTDNAEIEIVLPSLPDVKLKGTYKGWDHVYGLTVFSVSTTSLSIDQMDGVFVMSTGNSYQVKECDTVLFVGNPFLTEGSVGVARVTKVLRNQTAIDSHYRSFCTDLALPDNASGFLVNTSGDLVGILLPDYTDKSLSCGMAVGTEELKGTLNMIMNGISPSLLGIYGNDVTEALKEQGMPEGVYVSDVLQDGPAYQAGISAGDIITDISTSSIKSVSELTACMIDKHLPGETVIVKIMRMSPEGYKPMEISVTLGAR